MDETSSPFFLTFLLRAILGHFCSFQGHEMRAIYFPARPNSVNKQFIIRLLTKF